MKQEAFDYAPYVVEALKSLGFAAIALFFVKRYIKKTDESFSDMNEEITQYRVQFNSLYVQFNEKINKHIEALMSHKEDNATTVLGLRKLIMEQGYNLRAEMDSLKLKLDKMEERFNAISKALKDIPKMKDDFGKVILIEKDVEIIKQTIKDTRQSMLDHHNALIKAKEIFTNHKESIDKLAKKK